MIDGKLASRRPIPYPSRVAQPYRSLEAELHDAFWDAEDDGSEVRLMAAFLADFPGTALEMGSGSGRLMFPLLQAGLTVEGVELSADMIALGNARARAMAVEPIVHEGDMNTWNDGRKFAALLAPAFTLQLSADPAATLRHWRGLLQPGGGLYLTVFMPYAELLADIPENEWYEDHQVTLPDGRNGLLETRHRLDRDRQLVMREHRYSISGNPPATYQSRQTIHWIEHREMLGMLTASGFEPVRYFLDFDPTWQLADPDAVDFDGIITYHATAEG